MATATQTLKIVLGIDSTQFDEGAEKAFRKTALELNAVREAIDVFAAPLQGFSDDMLYLAQSFETSLANVSTIMGDNVGMMQQYREAILKMSTEIPQSATELSDALYQAISAGVDAGHAIEFVGIAGKTAVAGMTDTYTSVDALMRVINAYNLSATQAGEVSDAMFRTVQDGVITFEQLSSNMGMVAPVANAAGVSMKEMMAAIATVSGKIGPAETMTALAGAITELNTPASGASKALQRLGYDNLQTALKTKSLQEIMVQLAKTQNINAIFGREAARAVLAIGNSSEKAIQHLKNQELATGATESAYKKMAATHENASKLMQNNIDAVKINMQEQWMPVITKGKLLLADFFGVVAHMSPVAQTAAGGFVMLATNASKLTSTIASTGAAYRAVEPAFKAINDRMTSLIQSSPKLAANQKNLTGAMKTAAIAAGVALVAYEAINYALSKWEEKSERINKNAQNTQENYESEVALINQANRELIKTGTITDNTYKKLKETGLSIRDDVESFDSNTIASLRKQTAARKSGLDRQAKMISDAHAAEEKQTAKIEDKKKKRSDAERKREQEINELRKLLDEWRGKAVSDALKGTLAAYDAESEKIAETYAQRIEAAKAYGFSQQDIAQLAAQRDKELENNQLARHKEELSQFGEKNKESEEYFQRQKDLEAEFYKYQLSLLDENDKAREALELDHQARLTAIDEEQTKLRNEKQKELDEAAAKDLEERRAQELENFKFTYEQYSDIAQNFFQNVGKGDKEAIRGNLKELLQQTLDYVEAKFILGKGMTLVEALFSGGTSLIRDIPTLIAAEGAINIARGAIASFDSGGVPNSDGLAMVHRSDVIINPGMETPAMQSLVTNLANELQKRPLNVSVNIDGKRLVRDTVVPELDAISRQYSRG